MASNSIETDKRQGKGRQKTATEKIKNVSNRNVCFSKRKRGLMKKANELSVLTGAEVAVIVYSPTHKVYSFGSPDVNHVVNKYLAEKNPPVLAINQPRESVRQMKKHNAISQREIMQATIDQQNNHDSLVLGNYSGKMVAPMGPTYNWKQSDARVPSIMGLKSDEPGHGIPNGGISWHGFPPYQVGLTDYGSKTKEIGWFSNSYGGGSGGDSGSGGGFGVAGSAYSGISGGVLNGYGTGARCNLGLVSNERGGMLAKDELRYFGDGGQFAAGEKSIIVDRDLPTTEAGGSSGSDMVANYGSQAWKLDAS